MLIEIVRERESGSRSALALIFRLYLCIYKGRSFLYRTGNESMALVQPTSLQLLFTVTLCLKMKTKRKYFFNLSLVHSREL